MSNRTYFMNHPNPVPVLAGEHDEQCLLAANYGVALLWIASFEAADLAYVDVPCTNDDGQDVVERVLTFYAPTEKARRTFARRREALITTLDEHTLGPIGEYRSFLDSMTPEPFVQLDLVEFWMMMSMREFESEIRSFVGGVDDPISKGWRHLCLQACLDDEEVQRFGLRGFAWSAKLEWT